MTIYRIYGPDDAEHMKPMGRLKPVNEIIDGMLKTYFLSHDEMDIHIDEKVHGMENIRTDEKPLWMDTGVLGTCVPPMDMEHAIIRTEMAMPGEEEYEWPKWER